MKRLKTRDNMIIKKKMDSIKNDSRRLLIVNSMRRQAKSERRVDK